MPKSLNNERVIFPTGVQHSFLDEVVATLGVDGSAQLCGCSERTLRDWKREKFHMPLSAVHTLSKAIGRSVPRHIKVKDAYAHTSAAGRKGYESSLAKYEGIPRNERARKEAWDRWWEHIGKNNVNSHFRSTPVLKPKRTTSLAELIGVFMGDGSLSTYQATVTLHHHDDIEYAQFVSKLIQQTCDVMPRTYHYPEKSVVVVTVSRKQFVDHLHKLGLPIGNKIKQNIDIPDWIRKNLSMSKACLRGLIDTDGCLFVHRYTSKNKSYSYKKLQFTSSSPTLLRSVSEILASLGISSRICGTDVRIDKRSDVDAYFKVVGSHNAKHLKRYAQ